MDKDEDPYVRKALIEAIKIDVVILAAFLILYFAGELI